MPNTTDKSAIVEKDMITNEKIVAKISNATTDHFKLLGRQFLEVCHYFLVDKTHFIVDSVNW